MRAPVRPRTPRSRSPLVEITLTSINPALPTRDGEITLTGTVDQHHRPADRPAAGLFWRNQAPITDREGFDQALDSESNDPIGRRRGHQDYQNLYTDDRPLPGPGEIRRLHA